MVSHDLSRSEPFSVRRHRNICRLVCDFGKALQDGAEVVPIVRGQCAGHVFPHCPTGILSMGTSPHFFDDSDGFIKQRGLLTVQTGTFAGDGKVLAWAAKGNDVHRRNIFTVKGMNIAQLADIREAFLRHTDGKRLNFGRPYGLDARHLPRKAEAADAVKQAAQCQLRLVHPPVPPSLVFCAAGATSSDSPSEGFPENCPPAGWARFARLPLRQRRQSAA